VEDEVGQLITQSDLLSGGIETHLVGVFQATTIEQVKRYDIRGPDSLLGTVNFEAPIEDSYDTVDVCL